MNPQSPPPARHASIVLALILAVLPALAWGDTSTPVTTPGQLTAADYLLHRPNEIGRVPVYMYHNIVGNDFDFTGHENDAYMYRTYQQFWNDMLWLYENNFHLVGIRDVISGNIDIPIGKHPVVFTFDDASSLHFSYIEGEGGELTIDPNTAVGLMEKFYAEYPGFGRGAYFAIVPGNAFSWPDGQQDHLFEQKVSFLVENGYEIGNHTLAHPNLETATAEEYRWNVAEPIIWGDELVGADHPNNAMRVLTLPFGISPQEHTNPANWDMMMHGFEYEGARYEMEGILHLTGGSSYSRYDNRWNAMVIPRLPVQDEVLAPLKQAVVDGSVPYYTSDGDPITIAVPWPLPERQWGQLNKQAVKDAGLQLIRYNPDSGERYKNKTGHHGERRRYGREEDVPAPC